MSDFISFKSEIKKDEVELPIKKKNWQVCDCCFQLRVGILKFTQSQIVFIYSVAQMRLRSKQCEARVQDRKRQHVILTLASMYSILLSKAVNFSLRVAKRDRHDMSNRDTFKNAVISVF